jgi:anti-sigma regulatory factor (Ser/Thr protein kinase)
MTGNASVATVCPVSLVRRLPADMTAPGVARETTRKFLCGLATGDETDTAMLLVSELVTNSVLASAGMAGAYVGLSLRAVSTRLFVRVIDSAPGFPEAAMPAIGDEHGYGLFVVQELSARYGWFPMSGGRKCTYFLLYLENGTEGDEK